MFAGVMVLPAFALAYLLFAPTGWRKRLGHLLAGRRRCWCRPAGGCSRCSCGPTDARPYISNSTDNSVLNWLSDTTG